MCAAMNGFYGLKRLSGNRPRSFEGDVAYAGIGRRIREGCDALPEGLPAQPSQRPRSFSTTASTS